jgi:hypothetical protein
VTWSFSTRTGTHKGGTRTQTHKDYATGKTTTRTVTTESRTFANFSQSVNFKRGNRLDMVGQSDFPLDISLGGGLPVSGDWKGVRGAHAPWENLNYRVSASPSRGDGEGAVVLKGSLGAKVHALPDDAVVEVKVSPYLEHPVHTQAYEARALAAGVTVPIPYGWYTVSWTFECELLTGRFTGSSGLFPLARPAGGP